MAQSKNNYLINNHGDYIIYADESGDHSLEKICNEHPVFVLAFTIFEKSKLINDINPKLESLKFDFWGHNDIIFHSREIRNYTGNFSFLNNPKTRIIFFDKLNEFMKNIPVTIIASAIDKYAHKKKYSTPQNPYNLSLLFCLERLDKFLKEKKQEKKLTYIIFEGRGKKEDNDLELQFRKILAKNQNYSKMEIKFASKKKALSGNQIADLIAYPISKFSINPNKENRNYKIIESKIHKFPNYLGKGLKIFPQKSEIPQYKTEGITPTGNPQSILIEV